MKRFQFILLIFTCLVLALFTRGLSAEITDQFEEDDSGLRVVMVNAAEMYRTQNLIDVTHEACCRVRAGNGLGTGTCFLIGENGDAFFLTNQHVAGKKNSNVKIELWRDGKLQPALNGRVVLAIINSGYVDGAVVRIAADAMKQYGKQTFIPISLPSDPAPEYSTILSRGCPGGTWQTQFIGSVFEKNADTIKFYPRPGGGRSGSSVLDPKTGKIVALVAWSSDKPSHEPHGTDGSSPASGFGIAMNRGVIWNILQNKMPTSVLQRAPDEIPLLFTLQDDDFKTTPEDYEASLRRLRDKQKPQADGENGPTQRPQILPLRAGRSGRIGDRLFDFITKVFVLVVVVAVLAFVAYRLGKRYLIFGLALLALIPNSAIAQDQDYQSKMAPLAERWSADAVTEQSCWLEADEAIREAGTTSSSLIVLVTTENCPPCNQLKTELERLAEATFLNHTYLTNLAAGNAEHAKLIDRLMPAELKANAFYPVMLVYTCTRENDSLVWRRYACLGNSFAASEAEATDEKPTLKTYLQKLGVR
jgi:hypothetical protein